MRIYSINRRESGGFPGPPNEKFRQGMTEVSGIAVPPARTDDASVKEELPKEGLKMLSRLLTLSLLILVVSALGTTPGASEEISRPLTFTGAQFEIEDLAANLHSDGRILEVTGRVKNNGFSSVIGFATVYFKSADHAVLKAVEVEVNRNLPIPRGHSGFFETSTRVDSIGGLANVSVEFSETGRFLQ